MYFAASCVSRYKLYWTTRHQRLHWPWLETCGRADGEHFEHMPQY